MSSLHYTLPVIWALLIGTAVALYVVLDGFDLGIGILFPFFREEEARDHIMHSVGPHWDGNETWLVLGGGGLWVAFPKAYAVIMPALYLPIIVMLLALIFRGVSFEFRWVAKPHHRKWDIAFAAGSAVAAFAQGVVLGGLLQQIRVVNGQFAGGSFDYFTPFSLMCGVALVVGYALLGATWLILKTEGWLEQRARKMAMPLLIGMLAFIALVSIWTPLHFERIAARWFSLPNLYWLLPLPAATIVAAYLCWQGIVRGKHFLPFASAATLFLLAYAGLIVSNIPYLVPPSITIWDAAADPASQVFMLIGTVILLPIVLGYTALVFWLFRGKIRPGQSYHS
jgi:cytochrome bd ubiquinol oxidase subunit II